MMQRLARLRVPLGFASAVVAYVVAHPTPVSMLAGLLIALPGEGLRVWASGHLDKGREITRSGPYRHVRHPLYLGSAIMGVGFAVASASLAAALVTAAYLLLTLTAAIKTEEAVLDERFAGEYARFRAGTAAPVERRFSWSRVAANREVRALAGFVAAFALLWLRSRI